LPRSRVFSSFAVAVLLAAATAGCSGSVTDGMKSGEWFSKPFNVGARADGSGASVTGKNFDLGPKGPVPAEELVGTDGRCFAPATAEAPAAPQPPAEPAVGSMAGDLAGSPMPAGAPAPVETDPGTPQMVGGIALGMTECDAVRRAGTPANVSIGASDKNDRKVVLTYLAGPWPGIYTFSSGRLKEINAAPVQPKPAKPVAKKKAAKTAAKPASKPAAKPRAAPPVQIR
jgi:hypothetical protein